MTDGFIRVGAASPALKVANPAENARAHLKAAQEAARDGVKVLVFPELSLSCYTCSDLFFQATLLRGCEAALADFARESATLDLISFVGLPLRVDGKLYNCAAAVANGTILGLVPKTHIPNYSEFYEARHFAPAPAETRTISFAGQEVPFGTRLLFSCREMPELKIAAEICEDLWVSVPPSCMHTAAGATVIVNQSASDELVGKPAYRRELVAMHSARTLSAYLFADAGEGESGTDMVFSANSLLCENGRVLAEGKPFSDTPLVAGVIDLERLVAERTRINTSPSVDPAGYTVCPFSLSVTETALTSPESRTPFIPADRGGRAERCELILNIQSRGLAGRAVRAHAKSLVLGVSGGLDSTLALLVAVRAADRAGLDRRQVIAVTMPGFGTTARTKSNAETLSEELGVTVRTVDIRRAVEVHFSDISHDKENHNVVYENAQARERTQVLMDIANAEGGLVVGTGDLSELALGWATYNGDHMSMYAVNASVPKTLVRHIVAFEADRLEANNSLRAAQVLRDILDTPVSPELLPPENGEIAQCTEEIVGPYELHDYFLYYLVRFGFTPKKILRMAKASFAGAYDEDTIRRWLTVFVRRFFSQQFKRSCLPDGPKVGSICLSPRADWRMPSDADVAAWLEDLS
jgi:NAD+ synthase (glutamine-hydrolysing)